MGGLASGCSNVISEIGAKQALRGVGPKIDKAMVTSLVRYTGDQAVHVPKPTPCVYADMCLRFFGGVSLIHFRNELIKFIKRISPPRSRSRIELVDGFVVLEFTGARAEAVAPAVPDIVVYAHIGYILQSPFRLTFQLCLPAEPLQEGPPFVYIAGAGIFKYDFSFCSSFALEGNKWTCRAWRLVGGSRAAATVSPAVVPIELIQGIASVGTQLWPLPRLRRSGKKADEPPDAAAASAAVLAGASEGELPAITDTALDPEGDEECGEEVEECLKIAVADVHGYGEVK